MLVAFHIQQLRDMTRYSETCHLLWSLTALYPLPDPCVGGGVRGNVAHRPSDRTELEPVDGIAAQQLARPPPTHGVMWRSSPGWYRPHRCRRMPPARGPDRPMPRNVPEIRAHNRIRHIDVSTEGARSSQGDPVTGLPANQAPGELIAGRPVAGCASRRRDVDASGGIAAAPERQPTQARASTGQMVATSSDRLAATLQTTGIVAPDASWPRDCMISGIG